MKEKSLGHHCGSAIYLTYVQLPFSSVIELWFCSELHSVQVKSYISQLPLRCKWT